MSTLHPFFDGLRPTLHISHRGGAGLWPENTNVSFAGAVAQYQTDMLELDVHLTRDGHLIVFHDDTLERCTNGAGRVAERTLEELLRLDAGHRFSPDGGRTYPFRGQGVRLMGFAEVLSAYPQLHFNVDVKSDVPGVEDVLAGVLKKARALDRVCFGSEVDALADRLFRALPEGCQFYPRQALTETVLALRSQVPPPHHPHFQVLDMPLFYEGLRLVDADFMAAATAFGKWVNVWTVDAPAEMRRAREDGVGGIMTDRPDLLRDVLGPRVLV